MSKDKIVFHISYRLLDPRSGSQVHPVKMMQEFENLGLEILRIENTKSYAIGRPRALARTIVTFKSDLWKVLRHRYLFCFSETAHAPLNALERILYRLIKMKGIPLLIYVRDAHWLMPWYAPRNKEKVLKRHRRDMAYYNEVPDAVFVPTEALAKAIGLEHFVVLPPGAPEVQRPGKYANQSAIYVGGAGKFYDLDFLYDAFQALKRKHPRFCATLITRPKELPEELKEKFEATNTIVVAAVGDALADYYERSSVSLMPLDPDGYADLSMPVKLFEYLAYGLPVVSRNLREPAAFIRENECGVIADTPEEFAEAIGRLLTDKDFYETLHVNALKTANENTWQQRALTVYESARRGES